VLLQAVTTAIRGAAAVTGPLSAGEREAFAARDLAAGRRLVEPASGVARGIAASGALLVETAAGLSALTSGSLVFASTGEER